MSQAPPDERTLYGGQAVVEGVMMRSPRFFAIACRRLSDGRIVLKREAVPPVSPRLRWLKKPFLRGTLALIDAMAMGIKSLTWAANVQLEDETVKAETPAAEAVGLAMGEGAPVPISSVKNSPVKSQTISGIAIGATTVVSLLLGYGLFWVLPGLASDFAFPHASRLAVNLVEGLIRLLVFFVYVGLISRLAHVQRVFQYHGAEHKAINTLESGLPVTLENARVASRIHPRCGTNFIFIVLVTSIVIFSIVPRHTFHDGLLPVLSTIGLRLLLLPVVAGVAFEILKWAGARREKKWAQALIAPGLWTQYLTTRVPDDAQIETAIAALDSVWDKEHETPGNVTDESAEPSAAVA